MTTLGQVALAAVALLFMLSAPAFLSEHQIHILIQILFFAYLSSCWNILGGFTGQLSFGHALFCRRIYFHLAAASTWCKPVDRDARGRNAGGGTWTIHWVSEFQIRHQGDFFRSI